MSRLSTTYKVEYDNNMSISEMKDRAVCAWMRENTATWEAALPNPQMCARNTFFSEQGQHCKPCPPGTKSEGGSSSIESCEACPLGQTYSIVSQDCVPCASGKQPRPARKI